MQQLHFLHNLLVALLDWRKLSAKTQDFMFNRGTAFVEVVSGLMLVMLALALFWGDPFLSGILKRESPVMLSYDTVIKSVAVIGVAQIIASFVTCREACRAIRGLIVMLGSFIWLMVVIGIVNNHRIVPTQLSGYFILFFATAMAAVSIITAKNNVEKARADRE